MKKAVIIRKNGKPIYVGQVVELSEEDLLKLIEDASKNLDELEKAHAEKIKKLTESVNKLTNDVKYLKGEE